MTLGIINMGIAATLPGDDDELADAIPGLEGEALTELGDSEEAPFEPEDDRDLGMALDEDEDLAAEDLEPGLDDADLPGLSVTEESDYLSGTEPDETLGLEDDELLGDEGEDLTEGSEPDPDEDSLADMVDIWSPDIEQDDGEEGFDDEIDELPDSLPPLLDEGDEAEDDGDGEPGDDLLAIAEGPGIGVALV